MGLSKQTKNEITLDTHMPTCHNHLLIYDPVMFYQPLEDVPTWRALALFTSVKCKIQTSRSVISVRQGHVNSLKLME